MASIDELMTAHSFVDALVDDTYTEAFILRLCDDGSLSLVPNLKYEGEKLIQKVVPFRTAKRSGIRYIEFFETIAEIEFVDFTTDMLSALHSKQWTHSSFSFTQLFAGQLPLAWAQSLLQGDSIGRGLCLSALTDFFTALPSKSESLVLSVWESVFAIEQSVIPWMRGLSRDLVVAHLRSLDSWTCPVPIVRSFSYLKTLVTPVDCCLERYVCIAGVTGDEAEFDVYRRLAEKEMDCLVSEGDAQAAVEAFLFLVQLHSDCAVLRSESLFEYFTILQPLFPQADALHRIQLLLLLLKPSKPAGQIPLSVLAESLLSSQEACWEFFKIADAIVCLKVIREIVASRTLLQKLPTSPVSNPSACVAFLTRCNASMQDETYFLLRHQGVLGLIKQEDTRAGRIFELMRKLRALWTYHKTKLAMIPAMLFKEIVMEYY